MKLTQSDTPSLKILRLPMLPCQPEVLTRPVFSVDSPNWLVLPDLSCSVPT